MVPAHTPYSNAITHVEVVDFQSAWEQFRPRATATQLAENVQCNDRQPHCWLPFAIACRSSASPRNSFKNVGALMASPLSRASSLAGTESCMPLVNQKSEKVHCVVNQNPFVKEPPLCGRLIKVKKFQCAVTRGSPHPKSMGSPNEKSMGSPVEKKMGSPEEKSMGSPHKQSMG